MSVVAHRVFCISDLHLGGNYATSDKAGERGFRLCTQTPRLASFIQRLAQEGNIGAKTCELVINGDFIDFLAEDWGGESSWVPFVSADKPAAARLSEIVARDQVVFDALREFLAAGHSLTILLGNHDVELSLPAVQRGLERVLDTDGKRFRFISDGQAYVIGPVIIEHGNRYDGWNVIDHDGLRRTRSAQSRGEVLSQDRSFCPPAGSLMVANVMNHIKSRYPFVDLLKPENEATIPLLLTLAPEYRDHLMQVMKLGVQAYRHTPNRDGEHPYLGDIAGEGAESALSNLLESHVSKEEVREFFGLLGEALPSHTGRFQDEIAGMTFAGALSLFPVVTGSSSTPLSERLPALLTALITLRDERPFLITQENEEYLKPAKRLIERGFKVVLFGHTHLANKVPISQGLYLNTGTWADLIRFPYEQLSQDRTRALHWLTGFARELESGRIEQHIIRIPTYAYVDLSDDGVVLTADLHEFSMERQLI